MRAGGSPALQDHSLTQPEALHRAGDQRGLRQMGRVSGRWPAGDGAPRPPGRKSDHPQDQRQDLPHPSGQNRGQSGLREEAFSFFPISAPTGGQSVTPHLAPCRPPNWYPFSPPPTPPRAGLLPANALQLDHLVFEREIPRSGLWPESDIRSPDQDARGVWLKPLRNSFESDKK